MFRIFIIQKILGFFDYFQQKKIFNFLKERIKKESIFFDVGAHYGETVKNIYKYFKVNKIHCFEASNENYEILKKRLKNKSFNVKLNCFGLSNDNKSAYISQSLESSSTTLSPINKESKYYKMKLSTLGLKDYSNFTKNIKVQLETLDNYIQKNNITSKIELLKIDTEGHELYVLHGAKKTLINVEFIYFEHHYDDMLNKGYKFSQINEFLSQNNFVKIYKSKMFFRKTFEYIYQNNRYK